MKIVGKSKEIKLVLYTLVGALIGFLVGHFSSPLVLLFFIFVTQVFVFWQLIRLSGIFYPNLQRVSSINQFIDLVRVLMIYRSKDYKNFDRLIFILKRNLKRYQQCNWKDAYSFIHRTHYQIGLAYSYLEKGDKENNIFLAIRHFEESIESLSIIPKAEIVEEGIDYIFGRHSLNLIAEAEIQIAIRYMQSSAGDQLLNMLEAIKQLESADHRLSWSDDYFTRAKVLALLGEIYSNLPFDKEKNTDLGRRHYTRLISWEYIFRSNNKQDLLKSLVNQNSIYRFFSNWVMGLLIDDQLFEIYEVLGNSFLYLGKLQLRDEYLLKSVYWFEMAKSARNELFSLPRVSNILRKLATCHLVLYQIMQTPENLKISVDYARSAVAGLELTNNPYELADSFILLGDAYYEKSKEKDHFIGFSIKCYKQALNALNEFAFPNESKEISKKLGDIYLNQGEWQKAINIYAVGIDCVTRLYHSNLFFESKAIHNSQDFELYQNCSFAFGKIGNLINGLSFLEEGRSRIFSESFELRAQKPKKVATELWDEFKATLAIARNNWVSTWKFENYDVQNTGQYQKLISDVDQNKRNLEQIALKIQEVVPEFLKPASLEEHVIDISKNRQVIISLGIANENLFAYIIQKNSVGDSEIKFSSVNLKTRGKLLALADQWKEAIGFGDATDQNRVLDVLGSILQGILENIAEDTEKIVFIPSGPLSILPLHAALINYEKNSKYLIEDYLVLYSPNLTQLSKRKDQENVSSMEMEFLGLVDPENKLPFASQEGEFIEKNINFFKTNIFSKEEATKKKFYDLHSRVDLIHIASHGYYDWENPKKSALILANGELLTLIDIVGLDVTNIFLVVLSACQTGITDYETHPGEYIGLPSAFLQIGVNSVISTLWKVEDAMTAIFISLFYKYCLLDQHSVSEALQQAQKTLIHMSTEQIELMHNAFYKNEKDVPNPSEPFYWASFILVQ